MQPAGRHQPGGASPAPPATSSPLHVVSISDLHTQVVATALPSFVAICARRPASAPPIFSLLFAAPPSGERAPDAPPPLSAWPPHAPDAPAAASPVGALPANPNASRSRIKMITFIEGEQPAQGPGEEGRRKEGAGKVA